MRALVGDRLLVIDPEEEDFLANYLEHGQTAIYTGSNMMMDSAAAQPMHDYMQAALEGDRELTAKRYGAMQPLRDLHHRWILEPWWRMGLCPVSTVKFWTQQLGMTGGPVPEPLPGPAVGRRQAAAAPRDGRGRPARRRLLRAQIPWRP